MANRSLFNAAAVNEQLADTVNEAGGRAYRLPTEHALAQLAVMPEVFATQWQDVRACRLRKFPYVIYYRVLADRVEVLAVLHGSRDSSAWQSRT